MKRFVILALAATLAAFPAAARTRPDVDRATLRAIADRFDRAQLTGDRATLDRMIADDFILIGSGGTHEGKQAFIAGFTDPDVRFDPATIEDRYFLPLGPDAGIVGGDVVLRGVASGKPFASHIRFSDTYRRIGGAWKAVHVEATKVPDSAR